MKGMEKSKDLDKERIEDFNHRYFSAQTEEERQRLAKAVREKPEDQLSSEERRYRDWMNSFPKDDQPEFDHH